MKFTAGCRTAGMAVCRNGRGIADQVALYAPHGPGADHGQPRHGAVQPTGGTETRLSRPRRGVPPGNRPRHIRPLFAIMLTPCQLPNSAGPCDSLMDTPPRDALPLPMRGTQKKFPCGPLGQKLRLRPETPTRSPLPPQPGLPETKADRFSPAPADNGNRSPVSCRSRNP